MLASLGLTPPLGRWYNTAFKEVKSRHNVAFVECMVLRPTVLVSASAQRGRVSTTRSLPTRARRDARHDQRAHRRHGTRRLRGAAAARPGGAGRLESAVVSGR